MCLALSWAQSPVTQSLRNPSRTETSGRGRLGLGAERRGQRRGGSRPQPSLNTSGHSQDLPSISPTVPTPYQVTQCLQELQGRLQVLEEAWALRWERCKESWGLHVLRQGLDQAEAWLASRESLLLDPNCGVSQGPALLAAVAMVSSRCSFSHCPQAGLRTVRGRPSASPAAGPPAAFFLPSTRYLTWNCCCADTGTLKSYWQPRRRSLSNCSGRGR